MSGCPAGGRAAGDDGVEGSRGREDAAGCHLRLSHPSSSSSPSSSWRQRSAEAVWPENFVEAVAVRVAIDATRSAGRLAAAPAVAVLFQVCSTWRNVSRSELLWQQLARRVWRRRRTLQPSWRVEFLQLHRTGCNFRYRRSLSSQLLPPSPSALACCRLAISDDHLAAGFLDGSVCLFHLPSGRRSLAMYGSDPRRDRLGHFSQSISGLALLPDPARLVYSSQDGDIYVALLDDGPVSGPSRRARVGSLVEDGAMVDFAADDRWWVGLFAGAPGRSWRVWDAATEELVYAGGSLTDPDAVLGWRALGASDAQAVGRVRIAAPGIVVGCTASAVQVLDADADIGYVLGEVDLRRGAVVNTADACDGRVVVVDLGGVAEVRSVPALEEVCRFTATAEGGEQLLLQHGGTAVAGCMNWGYAMVCSGQVIRVWDAVTGEYMYSFRERLSGAGSVMAAGDRYVGAWSNGGGLQLWDFGAL